MHTQSISGVGQTHSEVITHSGDVHTPSTAFMHTQLCSEDVHNQSKAFTYTRLALSGVQLYSMLTQMQSALIGLMEGMC